MAKSVDAIAVVIPARNEEVLLGACLLSVGVASQLARLTGIEIRTVVVANQCDDHTVSIARNFGVDVLVSAARNVGQARAHGCDWAAQAFAHVEPSRLWLATTDADSRVSPQWLTTHVEAAEDGADAFAGTIILQPADAADNSTWVTHYEQSITSDACHQHVHGANLGVRADAYRRSRGFADVQTGEDRLLIEDLCRTGANVAWIATEPVITSARRIARAPGGVSDDIQRLAQTRSLSRSWLFSRPLRLLVQLSR